MNHTPRNKPLISTPVLCVALLIILSGIARATQSVQDTVLTLTTGAWRQESAEADHADVFKTDGNFMKGLVSPDGKFTEIKGYGGLWIVTSSTVELSYLQWPTRRDTFYLPLDPAGTHGIDERGHAITMKKLSAPVKVIEDVQGYPKAAIKSPSPPIPEDVQRTASDLVKTYRESLQFVTGSNGAGSSFIAAIGPSYYIITNIHVAAALTDATFTSLDGADVHGGAPSLAVGEDLFRMNYPHTVPHPFAIMQDVQKNVSIGDFVVVLGNAQGAGVVNTLIGRIVGIGPNLVEVDAPFVPGNSGSPIIHLKSKKVIGVATYALFNPFVSDDQSVIRRFGYRLDTVKSWEPVEWPSFKTQVQLVDAIEKRTRELQLTFMGLSMNGKPMAGSPPDLVKDVADWHAMAKKKGKWDQKEIANEKLASILHNACQSDITSAQSLITYDYFKRAVVYEKAARDQLNATVWDIIKQMIH